MGVRRLRCLAAVMAMGVALGATACGGATAAPAPPPPANPCGGTATSGSTTMALSVDGHSRTVIVHVPRGYTGKRRVALVLNLHGSGSTARQQELLTGMDATADQDGFIVAYPQGLLRSGAGYDWSIPGVPLFGGAAVPKGAANDVRFLTDLVPALASRYCIDTTRVYATGLSGGGRMSSQLACDAAGTFAAVAPVAGLRLPSPCASSRPVPVIAFHGTADRIDPCGGNGQAYWTYSVPSAAARWAAHDGCQSTPTTVSGSGYTLTTYGACGGGSGSAVELYTLQGEGHEWPGGPRLPARDVALLGPQSDAVSANAAMWAFFAAHPG